MNNEDAKATIKQAILNGYADTYKNPAQDMIESIYDAIMAPHIRWALKQLANEDYRTPEQIRDDIDDNLFDYEYD